MASPSTVLLVCNTAATDRNDKERGKISMDTGKPQLYITMFMVCSIKHDVLSEIRTSGPA